MKEEIADKISYGVRGSILLLAYSSRVLRTNIGLALLINQCSIRGKMYPDPTPRQL
jgi:hypothetical protein